jgi:hypothetical protein
MSNHAAHRRPHQPRRPARTRSGSSLLVSFFVTVPQDGPAVVHHNQAEAAAHARSLSLDGVELVTVEIEAPAWSVPPDGLKVALPRGVFDEVAADRIDSLELALVGAMGTAADEPGTAWLVTLASTGQTVVASDGPGAFAAAGYWAARGEVVALWRACNWGAPGTPPVGASTVVPAVARWALPEVAAKVRARGHEVEDDNGRRFAFLAGATVGAIPRPSKNWDLVGILVAQSPEAAEVAS